MGRKRLTQEEKNKILELRDSGVTAANIACRFSISPQAVHRIVREERQKHEDGITLDNANEKHRAVMEQKRADHAAQTSWMEHVTPLHQHKQRLEAEIAKRQDALDQAKQEYRNFLATLGQLMEETV